MIEKSRRCVDDRESGAVEDLGAKTVYSEAIHQLVSEWTVLLGK